MSLYEKHIFVCENKRDETNPIGCCFFKNGVQIIESLKKMCNSSPLRGKVRVNRAGCLGHCRFGPVLVIYPQAIWYGQFSLEDLPEIFEKSVLGNQVIERLVIAEPLKT